MSTAKLRKDSSRRATAAGRCAGARAWTGPPTRAPLLASAPRTAGVPQPPRHSARGGADGSPRRPVARRPQQIVAADAKEEQPGGVLVQRRGQARQRLRRDLARDAGTHQARADQLLELRRVARLLGGAAAEGQAVAE